MPRLCGACISPRLTEINLALLRHAASYRTIALEFNVSPYTLQRHEREHIHWAWQDSKELQAKMSTDALLARLAEMDAVLDRILARGEAAGDDRLLLAAVDTARRNVLGRAKIGLAGEFEARMDAVLDALVAKREEHDHEQ
jgi:hypothetical protein